MIFKHIFRFFSGHIFSKNVKKNPEKWGWGQLWFWGSGPESCSPDLAPEFSIFFGHETGRHESFLSFSTTDRRNFSR